MYDMSPLNAGFPINSRMQATGSHNQSSSSSESLSVSTSIAAFSPWVSPCTRISWHVHSGPVGSLLINLKNLYLLWKLGCVQFQVYPTSQRLLFIMPVCILTIGNFRNSSMAHWLALQISHSVSSYSSRLANGEYALPPVVS